MTVRILTVVLVSVACMMSGCASDNLSGERISRSDSRQAYRLEYGRIVAVEPILIEGEATSIGTTGGGLIGYSVGRSTTDSRVGGAVGAVAGAVTGQKTEEKLTEVDGLQITVDMDGGPTIVVIQGGDVPFAEGERVRVFRRGNEARILKM